jgi:hypothetical protein
MQDWIHFNERFNISLSVMLFFCLFKMFIWQQFAYQIGMKSETIIYFILECTTLPYQHLFFYYKKYSVNVVKKWQENNYNIYHAYNY